MSTSIEVGIIVLIKRLSVSVHCKIDKRQVGFLTLMSFRSWPLKLVHYSKQFLYVRWLRCPPVWLNILFTWKLKWIPQDNLFDSMHLLGIKGVSVFMKSTCPSTQVTNGYTYMILFFTKKDNIRYTYL